MQFLGLEIGWWLGIGCGALLVGTIIWTGIYKDGSLWRDLGGANLGVTEAVLACGIVVVIGVLLLAIVDTPREEMRIRVADYPLVAIVGGSSQKFDARGSMFLLMGSYSAHGETVPVYQYLYRDGDTIIMRRDDARTVRLRIIPAGQFPHVEVWQVIKQRTARGQWWLGKLHAPPTESIEYMPCVAESAIVRVNEIDLRKMGG